VSIRTSQLTVDRSTPDLGGHSDAAATFSPCRTYRYDLTRIWQPAQPLAAFIMLNPSTADAFVEDPTIRRCLGYARRWGAGGVLVLNAFALRSTNPAALRIAPDPVGPGNDTIIGLHFSPDAPYKIGPTIVAWGVHATLNSRDRQVLGLLRSYRVRPMALGVTKAGHPRHPLYLRRDAVAEPYGGAP
jgi:hypothetical protein